MTTGRLTTLARPYAKAAFEYADGKKMLSAWEIMLQKAALISQNALVETLYTNPRITEEQWLSLFSDVLGSAADQEQRNFIHLLIQNRRLPLLPDIAFLFKTLREEKEKQSEVQVISAQALDKDYQQKLAARLTKRLKREVKLNAMVDPSLIGGVIIRAGDTVIDGSLRGKLNRLLDSLF